MQDKVVKIPFNYKTYTAKQKDIWAFLFKKVVKKYVIFSVLPILILTTGFFIYQSKAYPFVVLLGLGLLIYILIKWSYVYQHKKESFLSVEKFSEKYEKELVGYSIILSDFGFEYQDSGKSSRLKWDLFKPVEIFRNIIILTLKDGDSYYFTIAREEIGDEDFKDICNILKERLG
jgi:hypothetical protein